MREHRDSTRSAFNKATRITEMHYNKATKSYISYIIFPDSSYVDSKLEKLRNLRDTKDKIINGLYDLLRKT